MPLNLIQDAWIPVVRAAEAGATRRDVIRPDQIAEPDVIRTDWPRPDLNLACMELLVGLIYLAHPPQTGAERATPPDQACLRAALAPLAPAFNLLGEGPRFLQDSAPLAGTPNPPDMLFIDSAGASTARKNADLMVRRDRYHGLEQPLAAMALYTLQAFAPSGGAGNRTSMRGGGPMVTLVRPDAPGLWPLIWANVPHGTPLDAQDLDRLPWMRPTRVSDKGQITVPRGGSQASPDPEAFFGQPRRLRLVEKDGLITGVIQRPYGTNYTEWRHPLSPYYIDTRGQTLPVHPKAGKFGYRNWRGVILSSEKRLRPANLETYLADLRHPKCSLIVGGWAMDNMKPLDFLWSEQPVFPLSEDTEFAALDMIDAAEQAGFALKVCVRDGCDENAGGQAHEAFFDATQAPFEAALARMSAGAPPDPPGWLETLRKAALALFDGAVMPGLPDMDERQRKAAVKARGKLFSAFSGRPPFGKKIYDALGLEVPARTKRKERA